METAEIERLRIRTDDHIYLMRSITFASLVNQAFHTNWSGVCVCVCVLHSIHTLQSERKVGMLFRTEMSR